MRYAKRKNLTVVLFILGLLLFLFADDLGKSESLFQFFSQFTNGNKEWIVEAIKDIGFLLAIGVSTHWTSEWLTKDEEIEVIEKALECILDNDKNFLRQGLKRIESVDLMRFAKSLQKGDTVYWNDNFTVGFDSLIDTIISKVKLGVDFRFLAIAPHCHNVQRREEEVDKDYSQDFVNAGRSYYDLCDEYVGNVKGIIQKVNAKNFREAHPASGSVQLKLLRSAPGIPFYMVKRNAGTPEEELYRCLTGFYLAKPSNRFIHLEWINVSSTADNDMVPIQELEGFFKKRWALARVPELSSPWVGRWEYECKDFRDPSIVNKGTCTIIEKDGAISVIGTRKQSDGKSSSIDWYSVAVYMDSRTKQGSINFFVYYKLKLSNLDLDVPGFLLLKLAEPPNETAEHGNLPNESRAKLPGEMEGEYHLFDDNSTLCTEIEEVDKVVNSKDGSIVLTRSLERSAEQATVPCG